MRRQRVPLQALGVVWMPRVEHAHRVRLQGGTAAAAGWWRRQGAGFVQRRGAPRRPLPCLPRTCGSAEQRAPAASPAAGPPTDPPSGPAPRPAGQTAAPPRACPPPPPLAATRARRRPPAGAPPLPAPPLAGPKSALGRLRGPAKVRLAGQGATARQRGSMAQRQDAGWRGMNHTAAPAKGLRKARGLRRTCASGRWPNSSCCATERAASCSSEPSRGGRSAARCCLRKASRPAGEVQESAAAALRMPSQPGHPLAPWRTRAGAPRPSQLPPTTRLPRASWRRGACCAQTAEGR